MFALDLFNTRYERQLQEGGVDNLEARRIDDLNMKMQDLLARAKEPAYKKNPGALAGLKRELEKIKAERDSYYKVREAGIPGNLPADQIPGKEDLLKGKGRTYYEGAEDYAEIYSPEAIALGKRFCEHYNITDDTDVQFAVEIIDSYLDEFKAAGEPVDLKKIKSGVADAFRQAHRGLGIAGPNFRKRFQEENQPTTEQSPRAYGVANFQRLVKANMGNLPTVDLEFIRPEENFKLDKKGLDLISDYYDGLESDQAKNYFIYRVLPSGEETLKVLKQLGYNQAQQQPTLPGIPTQGELPLSEKQSQKKNDPDDVKSGDAKTARQIQKIRALYPAARTDIEALAQSELDSTARSQQQLAAIRGANEKQDALLKQLVDLDKEQGREIDGLDQENNSLEQRLAQVQATNNRLQQAIGRMTGTKKVAAKNKTTEPQGSRDIAQGGIIDVGAPTASTPGTTSTTKSKSKLKSTTPSAMGSMAQQLGGFSNVIPMKTMRPNPATDLDVDLETEPAPASMRKAVASNDPVKQTQKRSEESRIKEHGGGIGPRQHWQDLMPEQSNTEDDDWYDDEEDQDTELRSGDYVRDKQDGEHGEVFRMQGDPYERRVRILDRDDRGWYIEPGRLTRVDPQDPDVQRYFGKQRVRDMDEATGDSKFDAMMGKISKDPWTQLNSDPNWEYEIEELVDQHIEPWLLAMERSGMPITRDNETLNPGWRKRYEQISTQLAQKYLASKKFNPRDPDLVGKIRAAIDNHTDQSRNVHGQLSAYADDLPLQRYADAFDADGMTANIRDAMAGLAPRDDDEDDGYAPRPTANPRRLDPGNMEEAVDEKGALKAAQAAAKFIIRNLDDRAALKDYSMHFWSPAKFYQGATMAMRGVGHDEIVQHIIQDRPAQFESGMAESSKPGEYKVYYMTAEDHKLMGRYASREEAEQRLNQLQSEYPDNKFIIWTNSKQGMTEMDKSQPSQERHGNRPLGAKGTTAKPVAARKVVKDLAMDLDQAFAKQKPVKKKGVAEGSKPGEYYIHTVYFKDGTKKRIRVTSDEFDVADYYTKRGQAVDRVDYDFQLHSDMTEAEKEPTTRQELLNRLDKIQRMMTQDRNPANLQILRKELEMLKQRYQHLREDNDSEAVERAILNRIMVAHTDLLLKYGPDKVMQAAEEVSYNVGDVDEIGTSDVSAYVNQVRQILGAVNETQVNEKWTAKYKSSINCANPKGFSQKAHCAGRKK